MITNVKPMACGGCGNGLFRFFFQEGKKGEELIAECSQCKSTSLIQIAARLTIGWGPGADGVLTAGEPRT